MPGMSLSGMFVPPREPWIDAAHVVTERQIAVATPLMMSTNGNLYEPKLSAADASYQKCALRYLALGASVAPAHERTRPSALLELHGRLRSLNGNAVEPVAPLSSSASSAA